MSDNKKYYYLKLKESFFDCEDLKVIEGMENGFIYSNLYIKMILLSLKDEGRLLFKGRIPYSENMLSTITGIPLDNVRCGIKILADYGMIEILESGVMYMADIQDLIGKGSTEAERKARYRKRINEEKAIVTNGNKNETDSGQCPGHRPPELELETELEKKNLQTKSLPSTDTKNLYSFKEGAFCKRLEDAFRHVQEFTDFAVERKHVKRIAGYVYKDSGGDHEGYCKRLLNYFYKIKKDKHHWLNDTPFSPSCLSYNVYQRLRDEMNKKQLPMDQESKEALNWLLGD